MGKSDLLAQRYSPENIERIEIEGAGSKYNELIEKLEKLENELGVEYVESEEPSTYTLGASMNIISSGLSVQLEGEELEDLDLIELLEN